jgi:hypothetical protein
MPTRQAKKIKQVRRQPAGGKTLAGITFWVQIDTMKRSIDLDEELAAEVDRAASLVQEKPATILRLAIRAGLPSVTNRFQAPRPDGYFADAYKDSSRVELEDAAGKALIQKPER